MFRSAATKIAHNSTLPALAGNKDLRPLQELITAEKSVLQSLQRLSGDLVKSSDCLRNWGTGEGDDLQDILTASTTLLGYVASALSQLATHEQTIREYMKGVRTSEENLDDLRRRRKAVATKADTAEKKLGRMNPEHKSLQQQTELLNNLREQIRSLDWDILVDEAKLGDFKRTSAKNWMILKFGGLLECAEKATIVSEMGKLVIEEIPLNVTQPGQARGFYSGFEKTEKLVSEAQRCVAEVVFDPQPVSSTNATKSSPQAINTGAIDGLPDSSRRDSAAYFQDTNGSPGMGSGTATDEFGGLNDYQSPRGYGTMPMPSGPIRISGEGSRLGSTINGGGSSIQGSSNNVYPPPASPPASRYGGQFATFPSRKASLPGARVSPPSPLPADQGIGFQPGEGTSSFASEVADALAYAERDGDEAPPTPLKGNQDGPAPSYEPRVWGAPPLAPSGLPRGAAPPTERNPWETGPPPPTIQNGYPGASLPVPQEQHEDEESDGEFQLPYASPPSVSDPPLQPAGLPAVRHTRFSAGSIPDIPAESEPPIQERLPTPQPSEDEHALNAAAAREVARELDALTFNPPPGPPLGHLANRTPSPLLPPAPPFMQQQDQQAPAPAYTASLSPKSEGMYSTSRPDFRGSNPNLNLDTSSPPPPPLPNMNSTPGSPSPVYQPRPTMNTHVPSPSLSFTSASTYATPPEMPAAQPLRTGSPVMLTPGARTISAAAFKRTQMRSPSAGSGSGGVLPDVTPLSLRKKSPGLPGSPYPQGPRDSPPGQEKRARQSNESANRPEGEYSDSYDVISSYGESRPANTAGGNNDGSGSPGYGSGRFATNLEGDTLR
ncbi:hypothetical protein M0805_003142 [Coniferiporia weirii]|nr:hypothetical protein M0805_003142 [Coniferiporia weirii]